MSDEITKVVFRKYEGDGDILALFPWLPADAAGYLMMDYMIVGQHGAADQKIVERTTVPASREEAADMIRELERIGYKLCIGTKITQRDNEIRRRKAGRLT